MGQESPRPGAKQAGVTAPDAPPRPATKPRFAPLPLLSLAAFLLAVAFAFALGNPRPQAHYDYTFRIARALLDGELGLRDSVPWLNELVPFGGWFYSVFPLGSVLCQVPAAWVQNLHASTDFPARETVAVVGVGIALFAVVLAKRYNDSPVRRGFFVAWLLFGTWLYPNLLMGSAWQVALGFAVLGQMGALVFSLHSRRPLLAGFCFAVAFGNRSEVLLTAPLFLYLLLRHDPLRGDTGSASLPFPARLRQDWLVAALFCVFPFVLGVATLWYNAERFGSPLDFGYTRIPGVLDEYWYKPGLYSWQAVLMNVREMLFTPAWEARTDYPYLVPNQMGGSVLSVCPFLLYLVRSGGRDTVLRRVCWLAIALLLLAVLPHGNAGGLRFSYRYALPMIPWVWLLLLDRRGGRVTFWEATLWAVSVFVSGWSAYLFFWTKFGFGG